MTTSLQVGAVVCVLSADGCVFRMRFDGYQDLWLYGMQEQFTALDEIPGLVPMHGTTYAATILSRGFQLTDLPGGVLAIRAGR